MKIRKLKIKDSNSGFSLIEMLIYVSILGMVATLTIDFLIQIVNVYYRARAEREVVSNARLILETVQKNVYEASDIYGPTSNFNDDAGQISLVTPVDPTAEHQTAYIDFWIDNGVFWMRREGDTAIAISSPSVTVAEFRLERIMQGLDTEAVKITLQIDYALPKYASTITLNATEALRGSY